MTNVGNDAGRSYVFDQGWQQERERLRAIEAIWDESSIRRLQALGVAPGWHCLEVGAGAGSLAAWLCERVSPEGSVTATDLDTRFLEALDLPSLHVLRHDICEDALPDGFDLVHCRLLLEHLPGRDAALRNMIAALRPGGVLLVEEFDHVTFLPDPASAAPDQAAWQAFLDAFGLIAQRRGLDLVYGRRLFGLLQGTGLQDVGAEGHTVSERGGAHGRGLLRLSVQSLRPQLIETDAIDDATVARLVSLLGDASFSWTSQVMVAAWGTKA